MKAFEHIRGCDEWLVFSWGERSLAAPNERGHLIELASALQPAKAAEPAAWHRKRERRWPVHCLDEELRPCAPAAARRALFVFFAGDPSPFGLLCDQADVLRLRERGWTLHPIPPALRRPGSPLLGIAVSGERPPILLTDVGALAAFLPRFEGL